MVMRRRFRRRRRFRGGMYGTRVTRASWRRLSAGGKAFVEDTHSNITNGRLHLLDNPSNNVHRVRGTLRVTGIYTNTAGTPLTGGVALMSIAVGPTPDGLPQSAYDENRATIWRRVRHFSVAGYPFTLETKLPHLVVRPDHALDLAVWGDHIGVGARINYLYHFTGWVQDYEL